MRLTNPALIADLGQVCVAQPAEPVSASIKASESEKEVMSLGKQMCHPVFSQRSNR